MYQVRDNPRVETSDAPMPTWTFGATKASAKRSAVDSWEPFSPRSSRKREMNSSLAQRVADRRRTEGGAEVGEDHLRVPLRFAEDVAVDAQDPRRLTLHPVVVALLRHPKGASLAPTARSPEPSWILLKSLGNPCTFSLSIAQTKNIGNRSTFAIS